MKPRSDSHGAPADTSAGNDPSESAMKGERFSLYCSTNDRHPIHLVDIVELFWRELNARGVRQHWYSPGRNAPGPMRTEQVHGIPVTVSPAVAGGGFAVALNTVLEWIVDTVCLFGLLLKGVDVVQVRDKYWAAVVAWIVTRFTGAKFVTWLSFPYPEADFDRAAHAGFLKRIYLMISANMGVQMLYRFAMRRADLCFVQTEEMKRSLLKYGIEADKMVPVPMGISPRALSFQREYERDNARAQALIDRFIEPGTKTIFYLGTLNRGRELDIMIDALALITAVQPDVRLLVVGGEDNPGEMAFLQDRAKEQGVIDKVQFAGWMPIEQAWILLNQVDVCWSPIVNNRVLRVGSPTKLVEYMAFQKPVVANEHPEQQQILDESGAGYCVPWTAQGFADATVKLLSDPDAAAAMGARGLPWVQENRIYDAIADRVLEHYERLLSQDEALVTLQRSRS